MRVSRTVVAMLALGFALSAATQQQTPEHAGTRANAAYEVVSIKPSKPGTPGMVAMLPNGFRDTNATLDNVFRNAFGVFYNKQIIGLPPWTESDFYDIEAKVDADTAAKWQKLTLAQRRKEEQPMMQALLVDRCKLKFHYETKELPVYDLVIARSGPKMKEAPQSESEVETSEMAGGDGITLTAHALSMENLTPTLSGTDGRLVIDKTGLGAKRFDFALHWSFDAGSGPSLFTALEEQLGLKLVPSKEPVKVIVIDQMEKPSPN